MAPSGGHLLVPKLMNALKYAVQKTGALVRSRIPQTNAGADLKAVPIRQPIQQHPIHPIAALRQARSTQRRFFGEYGSQKLISRLFESDPTSKTRVSSFRESALRTALSQSRASPFHSALRPNLTGGALPRTCGGYSLGGTGARHFSHVPASPAQVLQNVSVAVRAFCVNGYQAHFDGCDAKTGNKRFKAVSTVQAKALRGLKHAADAPNARGTVVKFILPPTISGVSPLTSSKNTLESPEVLESLATDFSRSLRDLSCVYSDLRKLSSIGSLPISHPDASTLTVHFNGCDGDTVSAICNELGIQRGIVVEDEAWTGLGVNGNDNRDVDMALLFPWAPSKPASDGFSDEGAAEYFEYRKSPGDSRSLDWQSMVSDPSQQHSFHNVPSKPPSLPESHNPWQDENSGQSYGELRDSDLQSNESFGVDLTRTSTLGPHVRVSAASRSASSSEYEGLEGIYRFMAECEAAERRPIFGRSS